MQYLFSLLFVILLPNIALANKPKDLGSRLLATTGMVIILAVVAGLIRLWKSGHKKAAITILSIIGIWFIGSIVYDEMRTNAHHQATKYSARPLSDYSDEELKAIVDSGNNQVPISLDILDPYYNVETSRTKSPTRQDYIARLGRLVPDWVSIKAMPQFSQFLTQTTLAASNRASSYRTLLIEADNNLDPVRVAQIYNTFKREYGMQK